MTTFNVRSAARVTAAAMTAAATAFVLATAGYADDRPAGAVPPGRLDPPGKPERETASPIRHVIN
jgi:hypothetical protein